jgi:hypothetical protein
VGDSSGAAVGEKLDRRAQQQFAPASAALLDGLDATCH